MMPATRFSELVDARSYGAVPPSWSEAALRWHFRNGYVTTSGTLTEYANSVLDAAEVPYSWCPDPMDTVRRVLGFPTHDQARGPVRDFHDATIKLLGVSVSGRIAYVSALNRDRKRVTLAFEVIDWPTIISLTTTGAPPCKPLTSSSPSSLRRAGNRRATVSAATSTRH